VQRVFFLPNPSLWFVLSSSLERLPGSRGHGFPAAWDTAVPVETQAEEKHDGPLCPSLLATRQIF